MRTFLVAALVPILLTFVPAATAKEFEPGDLRLCNARNCVTIVDRALLRSLGAFVYTGAQPDRISAPKRGAAALQLRFDNGYVAGLIGGRRFDRFYSFGVFCGRFVTGSWYRMPASSSLELRRLAAGHRPLRVPARMPRSC